MAIPDRGGDTSFCNLRAAYAALPLELRRQIDDLDAVHCYQSRRSPRQMIARTADEIAELALYLASDASKYTSGQPFSIDGGWTI